MEQKYNFGLNEKIIIFKQNKNKKISHEDEPHRYKIERGEDNRASNNKMKTEKWQEMTRNDKNKQRNDKKWLETLEYIDFKLIKTNIIINIVNKYRFKTHTKSIKNS